MKVRASVRDVPVALSRILLAIPLSMALMFSFQPASASAITRTEVMARAKYWIAKRVRYSQSSYYAGYRRDCSGFVSMAWRLRSSYTSSSIRSVAHRIARHDLKPGDAVRYPGHVEIFGGWVGKHHKRYVALEESTWGKPALKRVRKLRHGGIALRFKGIEDDPILMAAAPPATTTAAAGADAASAGGGTAATTSTAVIASSQPAASTADLTAATAPTGASQ